MLNKKIIIFLCLALSTGSIFAAQHLCSIKKLSLLNKIEAALVEFEKFKIDNQNLSGIEEKAINFGIWFHKEVMLSQREFLEVGGTEEELKKLFNDRFGFYIPDSTFEVLKMDKEVFEKLNLEQVALIRARGFCPNRITFHKVETV